MVLRLFTEQHAKEHFYKAETQEKVARRRSVGGSFGDLRRRPRAKRRFGLARSRIIEFFQNAAHAQRARDAVSVVGIEGERKIGAHKRAHAARFGDVAA